MVELFPAPAEYRKTQQNTWQNLFFLIHAVKKRITIDYYYY